MINLFLKYVDDNVTIQLCSLDDSGSMLDILEAGLYFFITKKGKFRKHIEDWFEQQRNSNNAEKFSIMLISNSDYFEPLEFVYKRKIKRQ